MKQPITETMKVADIKFDPDNPNRMTDEQVDALRESLRRFGQLKPPVVDQDGVVCDGEHQVRAHIAEGTEEIKVIRVRADKNERRLIRQVMNKLHGDHVISKDVAEYSALVEAGMKDDLKTLLAISDRQIEDMLALKDVMVEEYLELKEASDEETRKAGMDRTIVLKLTKEQKEAVVAQSSTNKFKVVDAFIVTE